jgi:hypothetical protein
LQDLHKEFIADIVVVKGNDASLCMPVSTDVHQANCLLIDVSEIGLYNYSIVENRIMEELILGIL